MGVDSPKAKGTHSRSSWQSVALMIPWCLPITVLLHYIERAPLQLDVGIDLLTMQTLHELFVLHLQQDFDHTRYTSGQFQMPNVAFQRTNPARRLWHRFLRLRTVVPCADPRDEATRVGARHDPYKLFERRLKPIDFDRI